jgi:hypothetical protein
MARADLASSNPANPATPLGAILLMSGKKRRLIPQAIWGRLAGDEAEFNGFDRLKRRCSQMCLRFGQLKGETLPGSRGKTVE